MTNAELDALAKGVERLKLDLEAKDCLMYGQYIAGVKMGWNLCATEDEAGYAKITGNTEHIAELQRINHLRAQEGSAGGEGV